MRKLLGIALLLIIGLTSCEGRKTQNQALKEDIEEFSKEVSIQVDVYEPEAYVEREVDTLLSNGYRVKIKTYSDMDNSVLFTKVKDTINYQTHYRNYKFDILVEKEGRLIYKESFDKEKANTLFGYRDDLSSKSPYHNFNTLGVLKSIQVDDEPMLKDKVLIYVMYIIPETNRYALHTLFINNDGTKNMVHVKVE